RAPPTGLTPPLTSRGTRPPAAPARARPAPPRSGRASSPGSPARWFLELRLSRHYDRSGARSTPDQNWCSRVARRGAFLVSQSVERIETGGAAGRGAAGGGG